MKDEFPRCLSIIKAGAGDPLEIERLQNDILRQRISNLTSKVESQSTQIQALIIDFKRRTAALSPTQGFSSGDYHRTYSVASCKYLIILFMSFLFMICLSASQPTPLPDVRLPEGYDWPRLESQDIFERPKTPDNTGIYISHDDGGLRAFANESPRTPTERVKTQVDLVLPPLIAFTKPGQHPVIIHLDYTKMCRYK